MRKCFISLFFLVFCLSAHSSPSFRGIRKTVFNGPFILTNTSAKMNKEGTVSVLLEFSTALDPRSFTFDSVMVNNVPLSNEIGLSFNKDGNMCCFFLEKEQMPVKIDLKDVHAFNGKKLFPLSTYIKLESGYE